MAELKTQKNNQSVDDFIANEVEPDFDDLLYGYWEVELEDLKPIRSGGVVSTVPPYPRLGSS